MGRKSISNSIPRKGLTHWLIFQWQTCEKCTLVAGLKWFRLNQGWGDWTVKRGLNRNINNPRRKAGRLRGDKNSLFPEQWSVYERKATEWSTLDDLPLHFVWILATLKLPRRWEQEGGKREEKRQNILRKCEAQVLVNHWCDSIKKHYLSSLFQQ